MKDRFVILFSIGTTVGIITGIAIKNLPAAVSLGMIIGLISGLFTRILSKY